jgi:rare lipoprotein A
MSPIAKHSKWTIYLPVSAGVVLALTMGFSSLQTTQHDSVEAAGVVPADTTSTPAQAPRHWFQFGRASWYGKEFQGQTTASGETFDMNAMTCAHRSLPLGALIRVTNLRNHRSVVVRVNDRGPLLPNRVVDLSYAAAKILGFHGTSRVRLDMIDPSPSPEEAARINWPETSQH